MSIGDCRVSTENVTDDKWMRKVQSVSELSVWVLLLLLFTRVSVLLSEFSRCSDVNKFDFIFIPWRVKNFEFYFPSHVYVIKFPGFLFLKHGITSNEGFILVYSNIAEIRSSWAPREPTDTGYCTQSRLLRVRKYVTESIRSGNKIASPANGLPGRWLQ